MSRLGFCKSNIRSLGSKSVWFTEEFQDTGRSFSRRYLWSGGLRDGRSPVEMVVCQVRWLEDGSSYTPPTFVLFPNPNISRRNA